MTSSKVNRRHASLMVTLIVVSIPISFLNELNSVAALVLVRGADFLSVIEKPQRDALAMLFLKLHGQGFGVAEIFWGLWLFPLGLLVYKSRFLPRFLGVWLVLAGAAWVTLSLTGLLLPQSEGKVDTYSQPAVLGEVVFMLWLLIRGARPPALDASHLIGSCSCVMRDQWDSLHSRFARGVAPVIARVVKPHGKNPPLSKRSDSVQRIRQITLVS